MASTVVTPTATWHNTSLQQSNGDVTDVTVGAAVTGRDALDNIAYLTGANNLTQVRQEATVADLAALKSQTTQRDQDYFVLDSNKRKYQFDSASSATADDYSVVQPTAGTGRYILQSSAVPQSTTHRWIVGTAGIEIDLTNNNATKSIANGRVVCSGGNATLYAEFCDFNVGDVITSVELAGNANVGGGGANIVAAFYLMSAALAATTPTMTLLGTVTITAGTGNNNSTVNSAPLPVTLTTGQTVIVLLTCNTAVGVTDYIYWVALNGTRSYITE